VVLSLAIVNDNYRLGVSWTGRRDEGGEERRGEGEKWKSGKVEIESR